MPVDFSTREGIMKEWDRWVLYYREGGGASWPRDAFESLLDYFEEHVAIPRTRCPKCCEAEPVTHCENCGHNW